MKVCYIGEFPLPNHSPGAGPENVLYNLVKGICKSNNNIDVSIVTIRNDVTNPFTHEYFSNVPVHYIPSFKLLPRSFGDPIKIRKFIEENDFDLIHAHYPIALAKIMDMDIPKILTLHGIFHIEKKFVKNPLTRLLYHDYNTYMLKKILSKLDGFVAISPYVIDILKEMNTYDKMNGIFQINNPIDELFFSISSTKKDKSNFIIYPARITERKNQLAAIEVIKLVKEKVPDVKLILTGGSDKTYLEKVNESIIKNNLTQNVEYLGKVSRDKILELYQKASIVYLLSNQETQPMSIIESMATGTPVIVSKINSNKYLVENGVNGYLMDQNDPEKIAECTVELLANKEKRVKMGECARHIAQNKYNSDIIVEQTLEMYKKILGVKQ
ncbi:glycosyltransferase family 4 protein [Methanococcoides vulcani]|nr:glycosyltransferase family 4 protein [Methanococcoides vulcani]